MNSYYITYKFTTPDPAKGGESSAVVQAPPLSPQTITLLYQQLGAALAKQLNLESPPGLIITYILPLGNASGIILPGGGRG